MKRFISILIICISIAVKAKGDTVDNYQIYIKKVLVRNDSGFPEDSKNKSYLSLDKSLCKEFLELHFHHCRGYEGKRKVALIDKDSGIIKEFEFTTTDYDAEMNIPISFLCKSSSIKSNVSYSLVYYDDDVKEGRVLSDIRILK
jgi:hypothetical protein